MRPTDLGFRPPDERTAEYDLDVLVTNTGHHINLCDDQPQNPKGTNLPQAHRFGGIMTFHDKGTGQSVFCSSNSYNAGEMANRLLAKPGPTITKPISLYGGNETGQEHLTMIGNQLKYEPAWATKE